MPESASKHWPDGAERVVDAAVIEAGLDRQAERLEGLLADADPVTMMVLMNGGLVPAAGLMRRLSSAHRLDHVHATRYRGETSGGSLSWGRYPSAEAICGTIVLVDDIFDEGHTMAAVRERLLGDGAERVITVALVIKDHARGLPREWVDDYALSVPDRYVFGCGMDWQGYWRQLPDIWALPESSA